MLILNFHFYFKMPSQSKKSTVLLRKITHLTAYDVLQVINYIKRCNRKKGCTVSVPKIQKFAKRKLKISLDEHQGNKLLKLLGYEFGDGDKEGGKLVESEEKRADTFRFALEVSQALQLQDAGSHVVVSQDESFVNTGLCHRASWFKTAQSLISITDQGKHMYSNLLTSDVMRITYQQQR